ncbi:MAG: hypothetical protein JSR49_06495 [Proteobacteria bacterium]|nr:hypothetical protein [Pseudomonadota bacterium]
MDAQGTELTAADLWRLLADEYRIETLPVPRYRLSRPEDEAAAGEVELSADLPLDAGAARIRGRGNGPIDAFVDGLCRVAGQSLRVLDYRQHAVGEGADARSAAYVELRVADRVTRFGVAVDADIVTASLKAVISALLRAGVVIPPGRQDTGVAPEREAANADA